MGYIQFLAGEYGENKYKYIKNKDKMHCLSKIFAKKMFISDIQSVEVANQENCKKAGGTIAGAVAGDFCLSTFEKKHKRGGSFKKVLCSILIFFAVLIAVVIIGENKTSNNTNQPIQQIQTNSQKAK